MSEAELSTSLEKRELTVEGASIVCMCWRWGCVLIAARGSVHCFSP